MLLDRQGHCLTTNRPGLEMMGLEKANLQNKPFSDLWPSDLHPLISESLNEALQGKRCEFVLFRIADEKKQWWNVSFTPTYDKNGQVDKIIAISDDITEKRKVLKEKESLQDQLHQSQKLEAIGRLAGGVAHDFNNILTAIIGYSEMGLIKAGDNEEIREKFQIIFESGQRAAALTEQLLLFSRKQVMEMKDINLNKLIIDMSHMINRLIGEDISFEYKSDSAYKTWGDKGKLEQVILNLAVNARDAMPDGGRFLLQLSDADIGSEGIEGTGDIKIEPGLYIRIEAQDTGQGISMEVQERIFEPFFTTKDFGKGTGLGLATVYGIIKQHKGYIFVDSTEGKGSTFTIYLPVSFEAAPENGGEFTGDLQSGGGETILVVEDETNVLKLIVDILNPLGYNVLGASNGENAMLFGHNRRENIDLLLTDVIMPGMNGRELSREMTKWFPNLKTIYMSGYTDDVITQHGVLEPGIIFINKPIRPAVLAATIRNVLDGNIEESDG